MSSRFAAVSVAVLAALFSACSVASDSFSQYSGVNLIPNATLGTWTPDQDVQSLNTIVSGELPNSTIVATAPYMRFERIDNTSGTYLTDTGFANSTALYSGMPSSAGTNPPVYRLEVQNLLINGDFEDATWTIPALTAGTSTSLGNGVYEYESSTGGSSITNPPGGFTSSPGALLSISQQSTLDYLYFDFATALRTGSFSTTESASYNVSFDFQTADQGFTLAWGGDLLSTPVKMMSVKYPGTTYNTQINFPDDTADQTSAFETGNPVSTPANQYLAINPWAGDTQSKIVSADIDNFSIVRTDKTYALSLSIPKLTDATSNGSRLSLQTGGIYTFKLAVRADPTATANNRFPAKKISIAVHGDTSRTGQYVTGTVFAASNYSSWSAWTELTVNVTDLLTNISTYSAASDSTNLLQINITALDTTNDGGQTAGSILIAAPRLYWSAE